jgi:rhodanese-related sulfurtransferase
MFSNIKYEKSNRIGFEDIKFAITNPNDFILINTLSLENQGILIDSTIEAITEEKIINDMMMSCSHKKIIVYGMNTSDTSVQIKIKQLQNLGFENIYSYDGGLFEWLLLGELFSLEEFPLHNISEMTNITNILLTYRPKPIFY